jgi:hypothetical protein
VLVVDVPEKEHARVLEMPVEVLQEGVQGCSLHTESGSCAFFVGGPYEELAVLLEDRPCNV